MSPGFGRRITGIVAAQIAVVFTILLLAGSLVGFGEHVAMVRTDLDATLAGIVSGPGGSAAERDVAGFASAVTARDLRYDVVVVAFDHARRAVIVKNARSDPRPHATVASFGDQQNDPHASGLFARSILGLATAFGLGLDRAQVGRLQILVKPNELALVGFARTYAGPLLATWLGLLVFAYVLARALTSQLLRPLQDVARALERFASGDLTPQPIVADDRAEFGSLAVAYNGAIAQMERAFAERDRANAAMRQFVADAGHQLRTPLTVIRGFIAILTKGELRSQADGERILATMNRQSIVMATLIEKLMLLDAWEQSASLPAEPIDVAQLASDVTHPIAEAHPARTVHIDADPGPLAAIDPSDLGHAITNLLDNALKYTHGDVCVEVAADGASVTVAITDEGPGLTEQEVAHVFDRFYRGSRREVDGSGLGLPIAKRAIERAGGTISVVTSPETGSRFVIRLPRTVPSRRGTVAAAPLLAERV